LWLEGLGQLKNAMISSEIEPETFRIVASCLNQLRYCVPPIPMGACSNAVDNKMAVGQSSFKEKWLLQMLPDFKCEISEF
jgi:hypothetical protein